MSKALIFDQLIKNVRVVRPDRPSVETLDLGIKEGKFVQIEPNLKPEDAQQTFDGNHLLAFPGVVDAHMHVGIYQPLNQDAVTESKAAAMGGVTSSLNYIRTGQYYLNEGGSYHHFFPKLLALSEGKL